MRDRLIELLYCAGRDYDDYVDDCHEAGLSPMEDFDEMAADYLLENGVIVPPCKRGDKIYCIRKDKYGTPFVKELEVRSVTVYGIDRFTVYTTKDDVWGQTAFATFEEAEKALKERGEG